MNDELDPIFKALADATRRAILDMLRDGSRRTTDIVEAFPQLSRFGVMKHLDVLKQANLVTVREEGRERINILNAVPLRQVYARWVTKFEGLWAAKLMDMESAAKGAAEGKEK